MSETPFDASDCATLLRTSAMHLSRQLRAGMQRDGLNLATLSVLGQLYRGGTMSPTELAQREGVKLQTLTRLLAELESSGWMARSVNALDARQSMLAISPGGAKRLGQAVKGGDAVLADAIQSRLSAEEQAVLLRACALLDTLGDALRDAAKEGGQGT